jgi:hypothetical protein
MQDKDKNISSNLLNSSVHHVAHPLIVTAILILLMMMLLSTSLNYRAIFVIVIVIFLIIVFHLIYVVSIVWQFNLLDHKLLLPIIVELILGQVILLAIEDLIISSSTFLNIPISKALPAACIKRRSHLVITDFLCRG